MNAYRLEFAFLLLLLAGAFVVRVWGISKVHFWDEAVYLQNAEVILGVKHNYSELCSRPPLLSLIFAAVFLICHRIQAAVIATALLNALAPVLLYISGRRVVSPAAAAIGALLLAFAPFFVGAFPEWFPSDDTGNSLLSDTPALTLLLLAFWLLLRAVERPSRVRFALVGWVFAMAVLMRFASLSSVMILALLLFAVPRWWRAVLACGTAFLLGMAPYLCWSKWQYGGFFETMRLGYTHYRGERQPVSFYLTNFGVIFCWITAVGLLLWVGRWGWRHWRHVHSSQSATAKLCWVEPYLWLWVALAIAFFFGMRHQEPRYLMPAAPPIFLLAGSGLSVGFDSPRKSHRLLAGVLVVAALIYSFLPDLQRLRGPLIDNGESEEMQVAEYLDRNFPRDTILYSNFNYPVFGYYTNLEVHELPESAPSVYTELAKLAEDGILVAYKPEIHSDPNPEWLKANARFQVIREFPSMTVYRFRGRSLQNAAPHPPSFYYAVLHFPHAGLAQIGGIRGARRAVPRAPLP